MAFPARPADDREPESAPSTEIRYLDGTTTATPLTAALVQARRNDLRVLDREAIPTARLLAGLSMALDLTEGQLPGHALRTCFLAMHLADDLGLGTADRAALFYGALLKDAGCSSNAAAITRIFGADDIEAKRRQSTIESLAARLCRVHDPEPSRTPNRCPRRLRRLIALGIRGQREHREIEQLRCERGAAIARKAGFDDDVGGAILDLHEHWDGGGDPRGLRGAEIHPLARILAACQGLDIFLTMQGRERAIARHDRTRRDLVRPGHRRGRSSKPAPPADSTSWPRPTSSAARWPSNPAATIRTSDDADVDRIAQAFADIVDAKSPFTGTHSSRVADVAEGLAARLGLPAPEVVNVRRAGLLHDLGKLGVPNTVLDKPGRLDRIGDGGHPPPPGADAAHPRHRSRRSRTSRSWPPATTSGSTGPATSAA